ncbi:MAG: D-2-hydroxyacid dehydrogenase [Chitinivibrionales bacterium]|nr:D-2-hydroxyacid dehydrogenase [Chitinivibrionales bacterium]
MNIVVLDGYTANPGDLSWAPLEKYGSVTVYDRTPYELIGERAGDAEIIVTNKVELDEPAIARLPNLKHIAVLATGYNIIDIETAHKRAILVTNAPGYATESVAQATFALVLELTNRVGVHNDTVKRGAWSAQPDASFTLTPLMQLAGRTFGIIGLGAIGRAAARIARALGMQVVAHSRSPITQKGITSLDLHSLCAQSDIVSLHCPLTEHTANIINETTLSLMKTGALLINTSRGRLVDESALVPALNAGAIAGAGLDVLASEPPPVNHPLFSAKNCIITPHCAWATRESRKRLIEITGRNIRQYRASKNDPAQPIEHRVI